MIDQNKIDDIQNEVLKYCANKEGTYDRMWLDDLMSLLEQIRELQGQLASALGGRELCPECGRLKARNVSDCMEGDCSKRYAVNDSEAKEDCEKVARQSHKGGK